MAFREGRWDQMGIQISHPSNKDYFIHGEKKNNEEEFFFPLTNQVAMGGGFQFTCKL